MAHWWQLREGFGEGEPVWTWNSGTRDIWRQRVPRGKAQEKFPLVHEEMWLVEMHAELEEMWVNLPTYPDVLAAAVFNNDVKLRRAFLCATDPISSRTLTGF